MEIASMTIPSAASYEYPAKTTTIAPYRRHSNDIVAAGASRVVTETAHSATSDDKSVTPT